MLPGKAAMKIKEDFLLREIAGEQVVIAVGKTAKSFNGMIRLNDTGAFLWQLLEKGAKEETLVAALLDRYDTDKETAHRDLASFLEAAREAELLCDE